MKPKTKKALSGMIAVTAVSIAFFVFGCNSTEIWAVLAAILLLAGKELEEFRRFGKKDNNEENNNG